MAAQLAVLLLKFEDARDSSQVDAFLLAELLRLREAGDVAQRIASRATFRTLRYDQAKAIVLATSYYNDPKIVAEVSEDLGEAMSGIDIKTIPAEQTFAERGW